MLSLENDYITVIVTGSWIGEPSSNPGRNLVSFFANYLGKSLISLVFPQLCVNSREYWVFHLVIVWFIWNFKWRTLRIHNLVYFRLYIYIYISFFDLFLIIRDMFKFILLQSRIEQQLMHWRIYILQYSQCLPPMTMCNVCSNSSFLFCFILWPVSLLNCCIQA